MFEIRPIAAFDDNYIWLLTRPGSAEACVVDPGDAAPVVAALEQAELQLSSILITHHHFDHVGALPALRERYSPLVYGPVNPAISGIDKALRGGDRIEILGSALEVIEVPGHTLDHIAYFHAGAEPVVFCGDTLFAGGCGRLFEGTAAVMYASLQKLAKLPPATRVYCAHEYTLANLRFALAVEPDNRDLVEREREAQATRRRDEPTVPSSIALELATNPFLRCAADGVLAGLRDASRLQHESVTPEAAFAAVRAWKDSF